MPHNVLPYSKASLTKVLAQAAFKGADEPTASQIEQLGSREPVTYLDGYLCEFCADEIKAKTLVVEHDYIDKDYLTEYSGYYSTAFQSVVKKTTRVHFFCSEFTSQQFEDALLGSTVQAASLQAAYLGFVVVRPMQNNFMGRTCLKHYPKVRREALASAQGSTTLDQQETRHYTVLRSYRVNLFGLPLKVPTIAFQEQDSVVGACASAALYALLHGVKPVFDTKTYSALEITRIANGFATPMPHVVASTRSLPNTGLTIGQMYQTLTEVGLSPTLVSIGEDQTHQMDALATVYAYLSAGLPVLAHVALVPSEELPAGKTLNRDEDIQRARQAVWNAQKHAFTLTGFSMAAAMSTQSFGRQNAPGALDEKCKRINKFYVHCDRIGPFAKFWVEQRAGWMVLRPDALKHASIEPSFLPAELAYQGIGPNTVAVPVYFIVPTSEKMRLGFKAAYEVAQAVLALLPESVEITFDLKVSDVKTIRAAWVESDTMERQEKLAVLKRSMPKYCWRIMAMLREEERPAFEVLLDCTAVDAATSVIDIVLYNEDGAGLLDLAMRQAKANINGAEPKGREVDSRILSKLLSVMRGKPKLAELAAQG